jgi:Cu/Ag efflux pump CusA
VARFNGRPTVFLGVVKQSRANTVGGPRSQGELAQLQVLPVGVNLIAAYDSSTFVEDAIHEVWLTLGIAFVLVVIVIFVFLRDFRSTIIPGIAIPVSIIGVFTVLCHGVLGEHPDVLALVLAIGIVVDDAIVVSKHLPSHRAASRHASCVHRDAGDRVRDHCHHVIAGGGVRAAGFSGDHDRTVVHRIRLRAGRIRGDLGVRSAFPHPDDGGADPASDREGEARSAVSRL